MIATDQAGALSVGTVFGEVGGGKLDLGREKEPLLESGECEYSAIYSVSQNPILLLIPYYSRKKKYPARDCGVSFEADGS